MTNLEKYYDDIVKVFRSDDNIALIDDEIAHCSETKCDECKFYRVSLNCKYVTKRWLVSQYTEQSEVEDD